MDQNYFSHQHLSVFLSRVRSTLLQSLLGAVVYTALIGVWGLGRALHGLLVFAIYRPAAGKRV